MNFSNADVQKMWLENGKVGKWAFLWTFVEKWCPWQANEMLVLVIVLLKENMENHAMLIKWLPSLRIVARETDKSCAFENLQF